MEYIERLKSKLHGVFLKSFGIRKQFIELIFSSEIYEAIVFSIDCPVYIDNESIIKDVESFKKADEDVYEIAYFIHVNRMSITNIEYVEYVKFNLLFSNGLKLVFNLTEDRNGFPSSFSICFRENENEPCIEIYEFEGIL